MTKRRNASPRLRERRRFSSAEKQQLVSASLEPGASVSAVAREAGIHPSQLYGWRRQLRCPAADRICAGADRAGGHASRCGRSRDDRDRVRHGSADADHRRGGHRDADGGGRGAGRRSAAMIPMASGVRVWIATGHTDMRRGMNTLALLVQEALQARSSRRRSLRVPRQERQADQDSLARWHRHVALRQAAGARPLHLAIRRRTARW